MEDTSPQGPTETLGQNAHANTATEQQDPMVYGDDKGEPAGAVSSSRQDEEQLTTNAKEGPQAYKSETAADQQNEGSTVTQEPSSSGQSKAISKAKPSGASVEPPTKAEPIRMAQTRQKRAAAAAAAKAVQDFMTDEGTDAKDNASKVVQEEPPAKRSRGQGKKRKSPEDSAGDGPEETNVTIAPPTAVLQKMTKTGAVGHQSQDSQPAATAALGRAGLVSLFGKKGIARNGSKGGTSLSDLIWQSKVNSNGGGTSNPSQPSANGLAALAVPQVQQAEKTSEQKPEEPSALPEAEPAEDQGGIHLEAGKATETNPERDTVMAEELTGDLPATQIKSENKVQTRASKAGPQKAVAAVAAGARLRPDGTPKRPYVRRKKPGEKLAESKPEDQKAAPVPAGKGKSKSKVDRQEASPEARQPAKKRGKAAGPSNAEGKGRGGRGRGRGRRGKGRGRWSAREDTPLSEPDISGGSDSETDFDMDREEEQEGEFDELFGCAECKWAPDGCEECISKSPVMQRPQSIRWKPAKGRPQMGIPVAPTFFPTEEEFADPLTYINKIRPEGERAGVACIVPPKGWAPPFALDKGTNGQAAESFRFSIRKQPTWQLSMRKANAKKSGRKSAAGRYDAKVPQGEDHSHVDSHADEMNEIDGEFGFVTLDRTHTLTSFEAYAKWAKALHFGLPYDKVSEHEKAAGQIMKLSPTVEEIEAEFWRIVETPDETVESLYGQDLDSGHHGSGFPLPPSRKRLLEEHLRKAGAAANGKSDGHPGDCSCDCCKDPEEIRYNPEEAAYSEHCWNINNLPRCKGSVLRYVIGDELITGVMVPWLYVGSCMSAFCWHIEDHALYSINYLHKGAPKVWYGVPAHASEALDEAMKDAFPHLFDAAPDLLYQLVTMLSPTQLKERGVPVHRLVHHEGSFVITFPNAYHAGFNTGFNCAEAVNFAPPDWLPWGCSILNKYRRDGKAATLSNDALLIALVKGAEAVQSAAERRANTAADTQKAAESSSPGDRAECDADRIASSKTASFSGRAAVPGQRADTSYLDPIKVEDAPAEAIRLAAAELALRMMEERRRREVGLGKLPDVKHLRMTGTPDEAGLKTNTEDMDCMVCKCDLWMTAIISKTHPDKLFCPEHASSMPCPPEEWIVLYRYTLEELDEMLETAQNCVSGTREAIASAFERRLNPPKLEVKKLGPLAALIPQNKGLGASDIPLPAESLTAKRKQKPRKAQEAVPKKEQSEDGDTDKLESGDLSDYPASKTKRMRKCKNEEGDWIPSTKVGIGPGIKRVAREQRAVTQIKIESSEDEDEDEPESDTSKVAKVVKASLAAEKAQEPVEANEPEKPKGSNKVDKSEDLEADNNPASSNRGRGKGRNRGRGPRGRAQSAGGPRGAGSGRGGATAKGKGRGKVGKSKADVDDLKSQDGVVVPLRQVETAVSEDVPQTVIGQVIGLDPNHLALWSEVQRLMSQALPSHQAFAKGLLPDSSHLLTDPLLTLQGMLQRQGVQPETTPSPGIWTPVSTAIAQPLMTSQPAGSPSQRSQAGNSVLMEILRASVQPQPRGYVAPGSIPLSRAAAPVQEQPVNLRSSPLPSHTAASSPESKAEMQCDNTTLASTGPVIQVVDDDDATEQSEDDDAAVDEVQAAAAEISAPTAAFQQPVLQSANQETANH